MFVSYFSPFRHLNYNKIYKKMQLFLVLDNYIYVDFYIGFRYNYFGYIQKNKTPQRRKQKMKTETKLSNPGPLGLLGFGMTTVLLNLHNAGFIPMSMVIIGMGFALGGVAQIIAGSIEFKHGNTFGGTAFTAYGFFWLSLVAILYFPKAGLEADNVSMGFYLLIWGVFTFFMFIGTLTHNIITQIVFGSLTLLFFLLAVGDFTGLELVKQIAGYVGLICGLAAIYSAVGQIVNQEHDKNIFPL